MKLYQKLERFPLGSIKAQGFLLDQMKRGKDGMCGHLHELEPGMINDPYTNKSYVKGWGDGDQSGWGAEISGNYWTGYIQFAYTLGDEEMIKTAENWVNTMMKKQKPDGYLGTYYEDDAKIYEDYNAWGTACALRGLIAFYEATGRKDVLDAVHKCLLWFCENWAGDKKTSYAGAYIVEPTVFTYKVTGDKRLLDFAEDYLSYLCDHDIFATSYKSMLNAKFVYNSNHTAGLGAQVRIPALVYSVTGNEDYLKATERRINQNLEKSVHLTGAPVSVSEFLGPVSATAESEYCSFAFYNATYSYLSCITGNAKYGELMERMFYNAAQGARKKDEKAIAYLSAPNQIYATDNSSSAMFDMQVYAPCYTVSCCPVNAVAVIPEFIRGMLLHDGDGSLYVMVYGPCTLEHGAFGVKVDTLYPFRNSSKIEITKNGEYDINLRIPEWSKGHKITLNGKEVSFSEEDGFAKLHSAWTMGDVVEISFKAVAEVIRIDDTDAAKKYPVAIKYGALVYSYHIPELWTPIAGKPETPLPEGWSWFNVTPVHEEAQVDDAHERMGLRKYQISWNVALDENLSPDDITVENIDSDGYAWEEPKIKLHTHCYKAPFLCAPYPTKTFEPFGEYQFVTEKLPLELVPYGCTNLRITYFPKADLKND